MFSSTLKDIMQAQSKTNTWIIQNIMIICLRAFQNNAFRSMLMSMIAKSFFKHSEGSRRALGEHSEGTWRALCHLMHWGTRALGDLGTQGTQSLGYLNTGHSSNWALKELKDLDTRGTLFRRLHICYRGFYQKLFQKDLISKFANIFC